MSATTTRPMPSALAVAADRTVLELRTYFREREAVFFNFLFPILMLTLFAAVFGDQFEDASDQGVTAGRYFLPGMISAGVMLSSFQAMALSVATERDDGTLKRLRGTPTPPVAYFLGKVGLVALSSVLQLAGLLLVARAVFGVDLPTDASRWMTFTWVFLLGTSAGTVLGIAYSSLASSARAASAMVIAPALILQFISGVYFPFTDMPGWIQQVASVFPLKWVAQGMRSVFFPEDWAAMEMAGTWEHGRTALVLMAWAVVGLVVCVRTFRWQRKDAS